MKLHITEEWLRRKILECDEPEGCPLCGAIAGCCDNYPACQQLLEILEKTMTTMRAKMRVQEVNTMGDSEQLVFAAVGKNTSYPEDGSDEDNTYARYTPSGRCELMVANPALHGKFKLDDVFYVDFTPVP